MITIIHNCYTYNPLITKAIEHNLTAINASGIPYKYILWVDNGDVRIKKLIPTMVNKFNFTYYYSDTNYGNGISTGGWIGAYLNNMIETKYCHCIGHDDFFSPIFWRLSINELENNDRLGAVLANCFEVDEEFNVDRIAFPMMFKDSYNNPNFLFRLMFSPDEAGNLQTANNFAYHCGVVYRTKLYREIGLPDPVSFDGAADFEYWARIVFNNYGFGFNPLPCWFYMKSQYSLTKIVKQENRDYRQSIYIPRIRMKYEYLYKKNGNKINQTPQLTEEKFW